MLKLALTFIAGIALTAFVVVAGIVYVAANDISVDPNSYISTDNPTEFEIVTHQSNNEQKAHLFRCMANRGDLIEFASVINRLAEYESLDTSDFGFNAMVSRLIEEYGC